MKRYICNVCGADVARVNSLRDASVAAVLSRADNRGHEATAPRVCNGCAGDAFRTMDTARRTDGRIATAAKGE